MSLFAPTTAESRRKIVYGASACALVVFIGLGVFAKNGWLPKTDPLTGKKTGWFGRKDEGGKIKDEGGRIKDKERSETSSLAPDPSSLPSGTPQLSKEYIYAGQRLLAVEDANANAVPPGDLAVWRPGVNSGTWWVLGGPGSQQLNYQYGTTGDIPSQGDYDGDGKTDFAVWRPGTQGQWFIQWSSDGTNVAPNYGTNGDKPVAADFDGDGKTDIAVYRQGTQSQWFIHQSSDDQDFVPQYGTTGDIPAPADYDGDGKADIAVWRDSTHTFWVLRSSDSQTMQVTMTGAATGSVPVPGDYDGDGKANFAVRSGASWLILNAAGTSISTTTPSGDLSTDIPVQNDYDGDGKTDIAVWRDSNGHWYIRKSASSNAVRDEQWGTSGDIPVPAFYRR